MDNEEKFWDFSTLHNSHPLYDTSHRNQLGLFKLEIPDYITSFVGLRPKVYSIETLAYEDYVKMEKEGPVCVNAYKKKNFKKLKGVKKHLMRAHFTHHCYKQSVLNKKIRTVSYFTIASRRHQVTTDLKAKLGLSR